MKTVEMELKELILEKYGSLAEFCKKIDLPVCEQAREILDKYNGKDYLLSVMDGRNDYHSFMKRWNQALKKIGTYETIPEKDIRGRFRSMKHSGAGIGTESVKNIVSRYNGVIQFETRGDLFCVSAMLYLQESDQSVLVKG